MVTRKKKEQEIEKNLTITLSEKDVKEFMNGMVMTIRMQGYDNAREFMEMNIHYKPIIKAMLEAMDNNPRIVLGNAYYYYGDTNLYYGKLCFVVDLNEYKKHPAPRSLVLVNFPPEKGKWAVRADSLRIKAKDGMSCLSPKL